MYFSLDSYVTVNRCRVAESCFREAMLLNRLAHSPGVRGRRACFRRKTERVVRAIRLAPEAIIVDEVRVVNGQVVGLTFPKVGRLHVKWLELPDEIRCLLWAKLGESLSPGAWSVRALRA